MQNRFSRCTTRSASNKAMAGPTASSSPEMRGGSESDGSGRPGTDLAARLTDPELYSNDPHPLYGN
jgi:hypothetical protein